MKLVLDSSIIIDYLRAGSGGWENVLAEVDRDTTFYVPTIVIYELFSGKSTIRPKVQEEISIFLKYFERINLTEDIAKHAGKIFRDTGKSIGVQDFIIAASAIEIGGTVLTLNKKHFEQIPYLKIYPI